MAGELYRALARNQFLQPIIDTFRAIQEQNMQEQAMMNYQNLWRNYQDQIRQINSATQTATIERPNPLYKPQMAASDTAGPMTGSTMRNIFQPDPMQSFPLSNTDLTPNPTPALSNMIQGRPRGLDTISPETMYREQVTSPKTYMQTNETPISDMEKYDRARQLADNTLVGMLMSPNMKGNEQAVNVLSLLIDRGANQFAPSFTERVIPEGAIIERLDKHGNLINMTENKKDISPKEPSDYYIGNDAQGNRIYGYKNPQGNYDYKGEKYTVKNIDDVRKYKEEKTPSPMDISKELTDLTGNFANYQFLDKKVKNNLESDNIEDIKQNRDLAWNAVTAQTDGLANKINSKYPGFEDYYYDLYQSPKIQQALTDNTSHRKTKIEKAISEEVEKALKGAPQEAKQWMRKILSMRIF